MTIFFLKSYFICSIITVHSTAIEKSNLFPSELRCCFFGLNEMLVIVWMVEIWLPLANIYLLEIQPILICVSSCVVKGSLGALSHYCSSSGIWDNSDNNCLVHRGIMKFILLRHISDFTSVKLDQIYLCGNWSSYTFPKPSL